jgi:hypothetical protein
LVGDVATDNNHDEWIPEQWQVQLPLNDQNGSRDMRGVHPETLGMDGFMND